MNLSLNTVIDGAMEKGKEMLDIPTMKEIQNLDWSGLLDILQGIGLAILGLSIVCIVLYILKSVGLYKMAKNENEKTAFLAFVPYGCFYVLGKIVGKTKIFGVEIDNPEVLLPLLGLGMYLPYMGIVASILFILALYGLLYRLYEKKSTNFSTVLLILSILFPFLIPIFLFGLRNK